MWFFKKKKEVVEITPAPAPSDENQNISTKKSNTPNKPIKQKNEVNMNNSDDIVFNENGFYDEFRELDVSNVSNIAVRTIAIDINIKKSNDNNLKIHVYGDVKIKNTLKFKITNKNHTCTIEEMTESRNNTYMTSLTCDINIPIKIFDEILVETVSGNINLENLSTNSLGLFSTSGDIKAKADFNTIQIKQVSGNTNLYADAKNDIDVRINAVSGNVNVNLKNISETNTCLNTISGAVTNRCKNVGSYSADLDINTVSGNILIN